MFFNKLQIYMTNYKYYYKFLLLHSLLIISIHNKSHKTLELSSTRKPYSAQKMENKYE